MSKLQIKSPVKAVREALGLTQEEMPAKLGCSITSERRFEYDATLPKVKAVLGNFRKLTQQAGVEVEVTA